MVSHNRFVMRGTLGSSEVWSTSVAFGPPPSGDAILVQTQDDLNQWAQEAALVFVESTFPALANALSAQGILTEVVAQYYGPDNTLSRQSVPALPTFDGSGTATNPYQTAIVLSMLTGIPGASYRGRNYWPGIGLNITSTGAIETTLGPTALATEWAELLQEIRLAAPSPGALWPGVFSKTKNVVTGVTTIRCGDVPDTQRRRRDAISESYAAVTFPVA